MSRQGARGAPLAREVRLLVEPVLGSWAKVLQLALLMLVSALLIAVVIAAARTWWPVSAVDSLVRGDSSDTATSMIEGENS